VTRASVLAVRADSLGDVILMGPAVRAIADVADVTMLVSGTGAPAARALPGVRGALVHTLPWIVHDPPPVDRTLVECIVRDVERVAPDRAIVFTSFHQSALPVALVLRLAGVPVIAAVSDDYPGSLLDVRHHVDDDVHEVERALSLVATLGYRPPRGDDCALRIEYPDAPVGLPWPAGEPYIVVHPGAAVPARAWAPDRYGRLVRHLVSRGHHVVVTGSPDERTLTGWVAGDAPDVVDLGGATDFGRLATLLADAAALVTGNTGPAHVAAAVGTPVVSLFAPTVPASRWRPWGVPHVLLGDQQIACAGCRARICPVAGHPCLDVPVEAVVDAVEQFAGARVVQGARR
jgi:ADP-heptose:LPS heptosyltransferase